jgi:sarcosine oxidase subunit gamma
LCLTQVIARSGKAREVARILGLRLPERPGTTETDGEIVVYCLRPRDWLILSPDGDGRRGGTAGEARLRLAGLAAAIDQSHARVVLRLTGEGARRLLQGGVGVDLDPAVFAPGAMAQTAINGIAVLIHGTETDVLDVQVTRSFAADLATWLGHSGVTFERPAAP